jgi:DNA polymerase elongation subunit (family B)
MAKKRYVGFKYESPDETEPEFDAKGIETVRRDGVLAQRKLVENCLKSAYILVHMHPMLTAYQNSVPYPKS